MTRRLLAPVMPCFALLGACALQPDYRPPALEAATTWSRQETASQPSHLAEDAGWWTALDDPQLNELMRAGLRDNPSLIEVAARLDQARAALQVRNAERLPGVSANGNVSRSQDRNPMGGGTMRQSTAGMGATLSWELDLWGRIRNGRAVAANRVSARTADAQGVLLAITGDIADTVLALRACHLVANLRDRDIRSRETEVAIFNARLAVGQIAPVALATAQSNLAAVRTQRIGQVESCQRLGNALVGLTGLDARAIETLLPPPHDERTVADATPPDPAASIAQPPPFVPALPATVLTAHPGVVAAEREMAARWSEIAVARAERLPRISLTAMLSGQWISALGSSDSYVSGSAGAGLTMPLFDGGGGAAKVRGSQAAYREAHAQLMLTIRTAVREIEDALTAQQSALDRQQSARDAVKAASLTLAANGDRFRVGAIAQVELEESRRQYNAAQESAVVAASDRARAWVSLVRRTGPAWNAPAAPSGLSVGRATTAPGANTHD